MTDIEGINYLACPKCHERFVIGFTPDIGGEYITCGFCAFEWLFEYPQRPDP